MPDIAYIARDFVRFRPDNPGDFSSDELKDMILAFGDAVDVIDESGTDARVRAVELWDGNLVGTLPRKPYDRNLRVLRLSMVDVQQGDGLVLETPPAADGRRRIMLIDGGDNQLFARHVAARFRHLKTSAANRMTVDLMLVTHGDADHFDGLNDLVRSETDSTISDRKRIFVHPDRIYHNGLVKGPSTLADADIFGATATLGGGALAVTALHDDPRQVPAAMRNRPFGRWCDSIDHWAAAGPITVKRIDRHMPAGPLFDFLDTTGVTVDLLGPDTESVAGAPALRFFHANPDGSGAVSASHTINGHSAVLNVRIGNVRIALTGDLNEEASHRLLAAVPASALECEVLKVPHHGSDDFDRALLAAHAPVVSLVSSGDESPAKEYIHPRGTLIAALGRASRSDAPVILSTELSAFFRTRDYAHLRPDIAAYYRARGAGSESFDDARRFFAAKRRDKADVAALPDFFAFERTNFGIIHVRTDGRRLLVFTLSGKSGMREKYAFTVDASHVATPVAIDE